MTNAVACPSARPVRRRRLLVIGVSGPDGSGKSRLVSTLVEELDGHGAHVETVYLYGCVFCRRRRAPELQPVSAGLGGSLARASHGLIDATELAIRLALARRALSRSVERSNGVARTNGIGGVLVTDRSPLDGLAKHHPGPSSIVARLYRWLADQYDVLLSLEAPPDVLAVRDGEHDIAFLADTAARHVIARSSVPRAVRLTTGDQAPEAVAAAALEAVAAAAGVDLSPVGELA